MFFCIAMSRGIPREEPYFSREESRLPRSFFVTLAEARVYMHLSKNFLINVLLGATNFHDVGFLRIIRYRHNRKAIDLPTH